MDTELHFTFRSKTYSSTFFIDCSDYPCYIFTILEDKELIEEFGDEVTIKTDGEVHLPKKDGYPELIKLREAMFTAIKVTPEFIAMKEKIRGLVSKQLAYYEKFQKLIVPPKNTQLIHVVE